MIQNRVRSLVLAKLLATVRASVALFRLCLIFFRGGLGPLRWFRLKLPLLVSLLSPLLHLPNNLRSLHLLVGSRSLHRLGLLRVRSRCREWRSQHQLDKPRVLLSRRPRLVQCVVRLLLTYPV